jgi:hypothetical protein
MKFQSIPEHKGKLEKTDLGDLGNRLHIDALSAY